jgi:hypothetical protein
MAGRRIDGASGASRLAELQWSYERDECWGPDGEPLLSARLAGKQLQLRVRNSRRFGIEVVVGAAGSDELYGGADGPVLKVSFDDSALQPLDARVQDSGRLAFVADARSMLAELNCTNRLRLHARPGGDGVWLQLDASIDDLCLDRLVEPDRQILLAHPRPAPAVRQAARAQPVPAQAAVPQPEPSPVAELIGAVAPLAAFAVGAKLGKSIFGPGRGD